MSNFKERTVHLYKIFIFTYLVFIKLKFVLKLSKLILFLTMDWQIITVMIA